MDGEPQHQVSPVSASSAVAYSLRDHEIAEDDRVEEHRGLSRAARIEVALRRGCGNSGLGGLLFLLIAAIDVFVVALASVLVLAFSVVLLLSRLLASSLKTRASSPAATIDRKPLPPR